MNLKKIYYQLKKEEFDEYLNNLKKSDSTIRFFKNTKKDYFFHLDEECLKSILELNKFQVKFDSLINSLDSKKNKFIFETFVIDEIKTTNATENIFSTRRNIFGLMNNVASIKDKKVKSILQAYQYIKDNSDNINNLTAIRNVYDIMMKGAYESKDDIPDGIIFRKDIVEITNGIEPIHKGFFPESEIIKGMEEFLDVFNNKEMDIYQRLILSHFLFETVHPFYDGNGRLGRLLFSSGLLNETKSLVAYLISSSINKNKNTYYKVLKEARDSKNFGYLNNYFNIIANIITDGINDAYNKILAQEEEYKKLITEANEKKMTKSEKRILEYLILVSCYSYYGTTNNDIIESCEVSKRTVITTIAKLRSEGIIEDTKIGLFEYHKIKNINSLVDDEQTF